VDGAALNRQGAHYSLARHINPNQRNNLQQLVLQGRQGQAIKTVRAEEVEEATETEARAETEAETRKAEATVLPMEEAEGKDEAEVGSGKYILRGCHVVLYITRLFSICVVIFAGLDVELTKMLLAAQSYPIHCTNPQRVSYISKPLTPSHQASLAFRPDSTAS
jgi:hypothetical protein